MFETTVNKIINGYEELFHNRNVAKIKINFGKLLLSIFTVLTLFYVLYAIICFWSTDGIGFQGSYGNSDLLYSRALIRDLIFGNAHFTDWMYAQMPSFFPDLTISYVISLLVKNLWLTTIIYTIVQTLFLVYIVACLLKLITNQSISFSISILFTLMVFLFSNELLGPSRISYELFQSMPLTAQHFGSFIMTLASLYVFLRLCIKPNHYLSITFFVITVLAISSDLLIGFYFIVPMIFTLFFCWALHYINSKNCVKLIALILLTAVVGHLIFKYSPLLYHRSKFSWHFAHQNVPYFFELMVRFFRDSSGIGVLWLIFLLSAPYSLIATFRQDKNSLTTHMKWVNFVILYGFIMIIWTVPLFIVTDPNIHVAKASDYWGMRHLQPFILFPVLVGFPLLVYKHTRIWDLLAKKYFYFMALLLLVLFTMINQPPLKKENLFTYYPADIACIDEHAKKLNLHAGIAGYWDARPIDLFNHSGISVVFVEDKIKPGLFLTSLKAFANDPFNFAIIPIQNSKFKANVLEKFGKPTNAFSCTNKYEIYVYNNGAMKNIFPSEAQLRKTAESMYRHFR